MAFVDKLVDVAGGVSDVLLGQRREDVVLTPEEEKRRRLERRLLETQGERAFDDQPSGTARAARTAGEEAIARFRAGLRSRQAGAGSGPSALLTARQNVGQNVAGTTAIERGITQAAQQGEAAELEALRRGLASSRQAAALDEEEIDRRRRKGLLPALLAGAGSALGPAGGALGGVGGQALLTQTGR